MQHILTSILINLVVIFGGFESSLLHKTGNIFVLLKGKNFDMNVLKLLEYLQIDTLKAKSVLTRINFGTSYVENEILDLYLLLLYNPG